MVKSQSAQHGRGCLPIIGVVVIVALAVIGAAIGSKKNTTSTSSDLPTLANVSCGAAVATFVHAIDKGPGSIGIDSMRPAFAAAAGRISLSACGPSEDHSIGAGEPDWVLAATEAGYTNGDFVGNRTAEDLAAALCSIVDRAHQTNVCQSDALKGIDGN